MVQLVTHRRRRTARRRPPVPPVLAVPVVVGALLLGGCASDQDAGDAQAPETDVELPEVPDEEFVDATGEDTVTIQARDNTFTPQYVTVSPGTAVRFDNVGRNVHNAIPVAEGAFDEVTTEEFEPGDEVEVTFDAPGLYPYYCSLHGTETRGMVGRIRVADA